MTVFGYDAIVQLPNDPERGNAVPVVPREHNLEKYHIGYILLT